MSDRQDYEDKSVHNWDNKQGPDSWSTADTQNIGDTNQQTPSDTGDTGIGSAQMGRIGDIDHLVGRNVINQQEADAPSETTASGPDTWELSHEQLGPLETAATPAPDTWESRPMHYAVPLSVDTWKSAPTQGAGPDIPKLAQIQDPQMQDQERGPDTWHVGNVSIRSDRAVAVLLVLILVALVVIVLWLFWFR